MIQFAFKFEKKSFYHQGRCCGFYRRGVHDNECVSQHKPGDVETESAALPQLPNY